MSWKCSIFKLFRQRIIVLSPTKKENIIETLFFKVLWVFNFVKVNWNKKDKNQDKKMLLSNKLSKNLKINLESSSNS